MHYHNFKSLKSPTWKSKGMYFTRGENLLCGLVKLLSCSSMPVSFRQQNMQKTHIYGKIYEIDPVKMDWELWCYNHDFRPCKNRGDNKIEASPPGSVSSSRGDRPVIIVCFKGLKAECSGLWTKGENAQFCLGELDKVWTDKFKYFEQCT